ncbi:MAG: carboxypeptidase regulatory-like domain-containing protein [Candidatus Riflebacteria bacterium]|nr:carboxypeptidase regulatory-like domain-containing protein [Candidatus Riflebacteria bacterium]
MVMILRRSLDLSSKNRLIIGLFIAIISLAQGLFNMGESAQAKELIQAKSSAEKAFPVWKPLPAPQALESIQIKVPAKASRIMVPGKAADAGDAASYTVDVADRAPGTIPTEPPLALQGYIIDRMTAVLVDGRVYFTRKGESRRLAVQPGQLFVDGDSVYTNDNAWLVMAFSTDNLIMLKPHGELRLNISAGAIPHIRIEIKHGAMMLAARNSDRVEAVGIHATFFLNHGELACRCDGKTDEIFALHGTAFVRPIGAAKPIQVPESYGFMLDADGKESPVEAFDATAIQEEFRRFRTWLSNFDEANRMTCDQISYRVDEVFVNNTFLSHMETDENGFRILDPGPGFAPGLINIRLKLTPYPRPDDRFEIIVNKDLVYALREGRDGFYEVRIPLPSYPEFTLRIHSVDTRDRRNRIFECRFVIFNRHRKIEEIRGFLDRFALALERRDAVFLRDHISRDYRDAFGHSYFDFTRVLEETIDSYRDIRLVLHPHAFIFRRGQVQVDMNYRLTALSGNWDYRYEDLGDELMTLEFSDGDWRLKAKRRGLLFQRIKTSLDLRLGVLRGRVTDEFNGNSIVGATVRLLNTTYRTQTDAMGEYVFYHLPPGKYDVEITRNGYGKILVQKVDVYAIGRRF